MKQRTIDGYTKDYKDFLTVARTERLCAQELRRRLQEAGFRELEDVERLEPGDRVFRVVKGRTVMAAVIGSEPGQVSLVGSHVDAPKLDLKPQPFFEDGELVFMKLHDYGWIKPYQWVNVPLDLRGIIVLKDGTVKDIALGNRDGDPVFCIPDIPPHIAGAQRKLSMDDGFKVSQLNALAFCPPTLGTDAKEGLLGLLRKEYGVEERDFACADLSLVPHQPPLELGFGSSLIGSYGHDDRSAVFASLMAMLDVEAPRRTALCFFVDKEEVASTGDTSAQSFVLRNFVKTLCQKTRGESLDPDEVLSGAESISADVTTGYDPNFSSYFDQQNIAVLGGGIAVEKYGAAGAGKFRANEARAEYMHTVRALLEAESIPWQTGTLAELGVGGGGTIAAFLSRYGMDCVDAGPCLLGMHSPFEVGAASDFYASYQFYRAFLGR